MLIASNAYRPPPIFHCLCLQAPPAVPRLLSVYAAHCVTGVSNSDFKPQIERAAAGITSNLHNFLRYRIEILCKDLQTVDLKPRKNV